MKKKDVYRIISLVLALASGVLIPLYIFLSATPEISSPAKKYFTFDILVNTQEGEPISNVFVSLDIEGKPPQYMYTGNDGYVGFKVNKDFKNDLANITIRKEGYETQRIAQELAEGSPSVVVQLHIQE